MAQKGHVFKKGGYWFLKYRDDVIENGALIKGKQCCKKLAPINDTYRVEKDLRSLREDIVGPINSGKVKPESTLSVAEYGFPGCARTASHRQ